MRSAKPRGRSALLLAGANARAFHLARRALTGRCGSIAIWLAALICGRSSACQ